MRGRKPKPAHLRVIDGNPGKRALPQDGLRMTSEPVPAPDFLDVEARGVWERIVPILVEKGIFTVLDHDAVAQYCATIGRWLRAERKLSEFGDDTYETHGRQGTMKRVRPELAIINECIRVSRGIGSEFGMTPVSRMRLRDVGQGDMFNPFSEFG